MTRRFKALVAILLLAAVTTRASVNEKYRILALDYDLDSTTDISCVYSVPVERGGNAKIATSGSSVTTTVVTAGTRPFAPLAVGDALMVNLSVNNAVGVPPTLNLVTAKASDDSITVGDAWTIPAAGRSFTYQKRTCGATAGWVSTEGFGNFNIATSIDAISTTAGSISFKIEGRYTDQSFYQKSFNLWPGDASADAHCGGGTYAAGYCTYNATTQNIPVFASANMLMPTQVRLVMLIANDAAGAEKVNSFMIAGSK